jgi:hypothetical protein
VWVCGLDVGRAGRGVLAKQKAVCIGGARALAFHSPGGDRTSLQCSERRFRWGESAKSEGILRAFDWGKMVGDAVGHGADFYDEWLQGGPQIVRQEAERKLGLLFLLGRVRNAAKQRFQADARTDDAPLIAWAREWGHTLGHRSTMGQVLMQFGGAIPAVKAFNSMAIRGWKLETAFQTQPFGCQGGDCSALVFEPPQGSEQKDVPRDAERAKEITELLHQVRYGGRPADDKWYRDFVRVVTEGGQLRITTDELAIVQRVHRLYSILDATREVLLRQAKDYADAVFGAAAQARPLSRIELLQRAASDPLDAQFKGTVFCVTEADGAGGKPTSGRPRYICASSPFLVAGAVHRAVGSEADLVKKDAARNAVKLGWCYGGTEGEMLHDRKGRSHGTVILGGRQWQGNPYGFAAPKGPGYSTWNMLELRSRGARPQSRLDHPKPARQLERLGRGSPTPLGPELDSMLISQVKAARPVRAVPSAQAVPATTSVARAVVGINPSAEPLGAYGVAAADYGSFSKANWMSCAGFQYSDAAWQRAEAEPPPSSSPSGASQGPPPVDAPPAVSMDPRAEKANDIMAKVREFAGPVVSFVMQFFSHAPDMVKNLSHPSGGFLDEWTKKITDLGKGLWDAAQKRIEELQQTLGPARDAADKARELIDKTRDTLHQAEVDAAKAVGKAKDLAETKVKDAKEAFQKAKGELGEKLSALTTRTKEVGAGVKQVCKAHEEVKGSGDLLGGMLKAFNELIMGRIMNVLEPNVRDLISYGMRFLRGLLGPIAAAVIGALGSIPFVGGALAPIGQVVYDLALNLLEDAAKRGLMSLIEKLLAQLLREALTPVFQALQKSALAGALQAFSNALGQACGGIVTGLKFSALPPRDQWLGRALACSARPLPREWIHREAAVARARMLHLATGMRRQVASYARSLADRYLARYGLTYDGWMAAVGSNAQPVVLAHASKIRRGLEETLTEMRLLRKAR